MAAAAEIGSKRVEESKAMGLLRFTPAGWAMLERLRPAWTILSAIHCI